MNRISLFVTLLCSTFAFNVHAQTTTPGSYVLDDDGNGNGTIGTGPSQDALMLGGNNSGTGISSGRVSGSLNWGGLNFFTGKSSAASVRRLSISDGGLVNIGALAGTNTDANLEVQATGTNTAFRVFPFTGSLTRSVSIAGPSGNPGLIFNELGNKFDIRCSSSGLELNKNGSATGMGARFIWDVFSGIGFEVGNAYNATLLTNYSTFIQKGLKANLLNANNVGIGVLNPSSPLDINDNLASSNSSVRVVANNKPEIVSIADNAAKSYFSPYNTGLFIQRLMNNNTSAGYFVGTRNVLHLVTDQVDNVSDATGLEINTGVFRSGVGLSTGNYSGLKGTVMYGKTNYGIQLEVGRFSSPCSQKSYGGYFTAFGDTSYGIFAEASPCGGASPNNSWAAYLKGRTEIDSRIVNTSGLKFAQMNLGSTAIAPNGKCLSVDSNGNVVLINGGSSSFAAGTGIAITGGVISNTAPSKWTSSGSNIYNSNAGNVGVGTITPLAKLDCYSGSTTTGINVENALSGIAAKGISSKAIASPGWGYGGSFEGTNTAVSANAVTNLDLLTGAQSGFPFDLKGVDAFAGDDGTINNHTTYGVRAQALTGSGNAEAIGLYGYGYNDQSSTREWALVADGRTSAPGGVWTSSDSRLKINIKQLNNALSVIKQLNAKTYEYRKDGKFAGTTFPTGRNYGFIAQELEKVIPEAVTDAPVFFHEKGKPNATSESYKAVNYTMIIPLLTQAIKEQQQEIEFLKQELAAIKSDGVQTTATNDIHTNESGAYLAQNVPNPFTQTTEISYKLPANTQNATIGIYDLNGSEIRLISLGNAVKGTVSINGGDLKAGIYVYTLIVDGKYFDSKKMILTSQ